MTRNGFDTAERSIMKAIQAARKTKGWSLIESEVDAFLTAPIGAEKFQKAAELSKTLYLLSDNINTDRHLAQIFDRLRSALLPFAQLTYEWYQKGEERPSAWESLLELFGLRRPR